MYVCMLCTSSNIIGEVTPANPPFSNIMGGGGGAAALRYFLDLFTHDLLEMLGMLVGHAGDVENDAGDVGGLV